jgi:hypothetical protein
MTALTPGMETALKSANPCVFGAVQIDLPDATLRLLDGSGELEIGGETFAGRDATFGVLAAISEIEDGMGDEAPGLSITLHPASDAAASDLSDPAMQGSRVRVWLGAVDRSDGSVIADPYLLQDLVLDQPTLTAGKGTRSLEYECVSTMERLFDNDEGFRLSDSNHQRTWPGELGFQNMSGLVRKIYWGVAGPSGAASGGGGGPGFFGSVLNQTDVRV